MASKKSIPPNNIRTDADEKQQTAAFPIVSFDVPQVGVFDAPLRYYPVNKEWCKLITGALELYAQIYAWPDAEDESDVRIQAALQIRKGFDMIIASCDDVENCLQTSPIINTIESDVATNSSMTTQNASDINDLQNTTQDLAQSDGNVYPAYPTHDLQPDGACGSAYYVVSKLRQFISEMEAATSNYPDFSSALDGFLSGYASIIFAPFAAQLSLIFGGTPPSSVLADYDNQASQMRNFLYCNGFDKSAFEAELRVNYTSGNEIADYLSYAGLGAWDNWVAVGSLDTSQDCSSFNCGYPVLVIGDAAICCDLWSYASGVLTYLGNGDWQLDGQLDATGEYAGVFTEENGQLIIITNGQMISGSAPYRRWCEDNCTIPSASFNTPPENDSIYGYRGSLTSAWSMTFHAEFA